MAHPPLRASTILLVVCAACGDPSITTITPENHAFPIVAGSVHALGATTRDGELGCESCHRSPVITLVTCVGCHEHPAEPVNGVDINDSLHLNNLEYTRLVPAGADVPTRSAGCYDCHNDGRRLGNPFPHTKLTPGAGSYCAACHDVNRAFPYLPLAGRSHQDVGASDCGACHGVSSWKGATGAPGDVSDPSRDVSVTALWPTWSGTRILSVAPDPQVIPMTMNHAARSVDAGVLQGCANCHAQAAEGQYYPGVMHWSLTMLGVPQPVTCVDCHVGSAPRGFSGDLDPARSPSTGPMRHDAVLWVAGQRTDAGVVTQDCGLCHQAPNELIDAKWKFAFGKDDAGASFHQPLTTAALPQPTSCLDCHANSRPTGVVTSATRGFDHTTSLGECRDCHTSTSTWAGGTFHLAGAPAPNTCLPCHEAGRPTSTTGWMGNFTTSPFDYVTNSAGDTHGAGLDCAVCHAGPGTGAWGSTHNWRSGNFVHGPNTASATACITCHTTQRPDLLVPPAVLAFDHARSGTGDCYGCHQATVARGRYVSLYPIPDGGDWRGGQEYPGATLITAPNRFIRVATTALTRTGQRVTGMMTTTVTLPNAMLHTSSVIPPQLFPGPASAPDQDSCWHCHTATGTTVTNFSNGFFHAAFTNYKATPAGAVSPLPQPTTGCNDCHANMRPPNIVNKTDAGVWLQPMDHAATFMGGTVAGVRNMDCSACHQTPGLATPIQWSDGTFHDNLPTNAAPSECVSCHYPLTTTASADVTSPATGLPSEFTMKHRAAVVTKQACDSCHGEALLRASNTPRTAALWRTGEYHSEVAAAQPATCLDCHAASDPLTATQGTERYVLSQGASTTNEVQWMNHQDPTVTGRDCGTCHTAAATQNAWSKTSVYHSNVPTVTACKTCHGTANGRGTVVGTNNNLPVGLVDSVTFTTSSVFDGGVRPHDQITHTDSNVTRFDCNFCHTQLGSSTVAGVQGKEWEKAFFHRNFTTGNPMVMNTTGRCDNCHLNLKPGPSYTRFAHGTITQDCGACHSFPGTSATTPNWQGATGAHATSGPTANSLLDCNTCHGQNGSSVKKLAGPAANHYGGIGNGNRCTTCHVNFAGFKGTVTNLKYPHTNATANSGGCVTCHPFTAQLYTTLTTTPALTLPTAAGGHQFSQTRSVTGRFDGDTFTSTHTDTNLRLCGSCHQYSATTAATNVWAFKHRPSNPGITNRENTSGCNKCH